MKISPNKLGALIVTLFVLWFVIIISQVKDMVNTILVFTVVTCVGLFLSEKIKHSLGDRKLEILGYFWLIKICLTFILLYAGWIPELDPSSEGWGYDPQRFYYQSQELIENNWVFIGGINYVGIIYFYAAIFELFGHNPLIPALINSFFTLIASLLLIKAGYKIKTNRSGGDWMIAWVLLFPEVLWFDVMTSRETIVGALNIFLLLTIGIFLLQKAKKSYFKILVIVCGSLFAIAAIRTSMLIPALISIVLMSLLIGQSKRANIKNKFFLTFLVSILFLMAPVVNVINGGTDFTSFASIDKISSASENIANEHFKNFGSENSIGALLLPEGIFQSLLFLPPRAVLYLVSPLPNISLSLTNMWEGAWGDWQKLFTLLSSATYVIATPYVLASLVQSIKNRKINPAPLIFHIPFWITFIAISGGNLIIHERYRVMASILFFGCAWLGARMSPVKSIQKARLIWYGMLGAGAIFYFSYKYVL